MATPILLKPIGGFALALESRVDYIINITRVDIGVSQGENWEIGRSENTGLDERWQSFSSDWSTYPQLDRASSLRKLGARRWTDPGGGGMGIFLPAHISRVTSLALNLTSCNIQSFFNL